MCVNVLLLLCVGVCVNMPMPLVFELKIYMSASIVISYQARGKLKERTGIGN